MDVDARQPSLSTQIEINLKTGQRISYIRNTSEIPKELMDSYQQILGDGKARVTVSADMGTKEYGRGVSVMVSVSLSCNQDGQTIANAIAMAGNFARGYLTQQHQAAEQEYQKTLAPGPVPNFG